MKLVLTVIVSLVLYSLLLLASLWNFVGIYCEDRKRLDIRFSENENIEDEGTATPIFSRVPLRFRQGSKIFFGFLVLSSSFDIPFLAGCFAHGSPSECRWDNDWYFLTYSMHMVALIGYFVCLGIPLKLWSDLIDGREESLFAPSSRPRVILISSIIFSFLILAEVITLVCVGPYKYNRFSEAVRGLEAFFYVFVAMYWTWRGLHLVYYLQGIMSRDSKQVKLLVTATVVMLIICICYLFRAALIMGTIFGGQTFFRIHYSFWLVGTRWLPYIVASFLLIFVMRLSLKSLGSGSDMSVSSTAFIALPRSVFSSVSERHDSLVFGASVGDEYAGTLGGRQQTNYFDDSGSSFSMYWLNLLSARNSAAPQRIREDDNEEALIQ